MKINNRTRFPVADDGETYEFKYAHNETYGKINDMIETYWQLYESGQISQGYFANMAKVLDGVDNTNPDEEAFRERIINIINQYELDSQTMINNYRTSSFNNKHNVLLVAHSQGNLFGNKMYALLTDEEKQKFQMVSVATPANSVTANYSLDAPYTTVNGDLIMAAIKNSFPSNADGFGHTFVDSYLNSATLATRLKINTDITNEVILLDKNSCNKKYQHFRWIGYQCQSRQDTELEVDIYGTPVNSNPNQLVSEEFIESDVRQRVAFQNGICPLSNWDYRTSVPKYDKNGCSAYTFTDTSGYGIDGNVAWVYNNQYQNNYTCTTYNMDLNVAVKLNDMQE